MLSSSNITTPNNNHLRWRMNPTRINNQNKDNYNSINNNNHHENDDDSVVVVLLDDPADLNTIKSRYNINTIDDHLSTPKPSWTTNYGNAYSSNNTYEEVYGTNNDTKKGNRNFYNRIKNSLIFRILCCNYCYNFYIHRARCINRFLCSQYCLLCSDWISLLFIVCCFYTARSTKSFFMTITMTCDICIICITNIQYRTLRKIVHNTPSSTRTAATDILTTVGNVNRWKHIEQKRHDELYHHIIQLKTNKERLFRKLQSLDQSYDKIQSLKHIFQIQYDIIPTIENIKSVEQIVAEYQSNQYLLLLECKKQLQIYILKEIFHVRELLLIWEMSNDKTITSIPSVVTALDKLLLQLRNHNIPGVHIQNEHKLRFYLSVAMGVSAVDSNDNENNQKDNISLIPNNPHQIEAIIQILHRIENDFQVHVDRMLSSKTTSTSTSENQQQHAKSGSHTGDTVVFVFDPTNLVS